MPIKSPARPRTWWPRSARSTARWRRSRARPASSSKLQAQYALGVCVRDLLAVGVAERKALQELDAAAVRLVGPVHREQDPVGPEREQRAQERRLVPVAARRHQEVVAQVLERRLLQPPPPGGGIRVVVKPVHRERQRLAQVPEDDLSLRVANELSRD